ncbi:hypothetical protein WDV76_16700 [Xenorhabdus griffiniae]|uniref:hypothetical protein n=1 Tax=Xenorhabdus griffiniae TaxID=351672 RepID=UPI0030D2DE0D
MTMTRPAAVLAAELQLAGLDVWRVVFPAGRDANRFSCEVANPENAFAQLLDAAQWLSEPTKTPRAEQNGRRSLLCKPCPVRAGEAV